MPVPWPREPDRRGAAADARSTGDRRRRSLGAFLGGSLAAAGSRRRAPARPRRSSPAVAGRGRDRRRGRASTSATRPPSGWSAPRSPSTTSTPGPSGPSTRPSGSIRRALADDAVLAPGDRLAGRRRCVLDQLERDRARRLRDDRAAARPRHLEDADPPAPRRLRRRRADLPARGHGDPGPGGAGAGRSFDAPVRRRDPDPPARAQGRRSRLPGRRSPTRSSRAIVLAPDRCCSAGCWPARPRPGGERSGAPQSARSGADRRAARCRHDAARSPTPATG